MIRETRRRGTYVTQTGAVPGADGWIERAADVDRVVAALTSGESGLVMVVPERVGIVRGRRLGSAFGKSRSW